MGKIKKLCTSSLLEFALVPYSQDRPGRGKKENLQWNETILFFKIYIYIYIYKVCEFSLVMYLSSFTKFNYITY